MATTGAGFRKRLGIGSGCEEGEVCTEILQPDFDPFFGNKTILSVNYCWNNIYMSGILELTERCRDLRPKHETNTDVAAAP